MKNKEKINKILIRDFWDFKAIMDKARIGERILNRVLDTQRHPEFILRFLKETAKQQNKQNKESLIEMLKRVQQDCHSFVHQNNIFVVLMIMLITQPVYGQHLKLILGQYDCVSGNQCGENEYCDIDTHVCKKLPICEVCETCEVCPVGEPILECAANEHKQESKCVACTEDSHCGSGQRCNRYNQCVECLENDDCSEACDITTNTCKTCYEINSYLPQWDEAAKKCTPCPSTTPVWNGSACVTCAGADSTKPVWNASTGVCEACPSGTPVWNGSACVTCASADSTKPYWNGTSCGECPTGTVWDTTIASCIKTCTSNDNCSSLGSGYYCYTQAGYTCGTEFSTDSSSRYYRGTCRKAADDVQTSGSTSYVTSNKSMTWWSAQRFCAALGRPSVDKSKFLSELLSKLKTAYGNIWVWTSTDYSSCGAVSVYLYDDYAYGNSKNNSYYALCE